MAATLIDIDQERRLSLKEAALLITKQFPDRRGGRALNLSTVHRWASRGLKGIRLEIVQVGGTRFTTAEAVHRFFEMLAGRDPVAIQQSSASHRRRVTEAEKVLEKAGI